MTDTIDEYRELALLAHAWEQGALPARLGFTGMIVEVPHRPDSRSVVPLQEGAMRRLADPRPLLEGSASQFGG